MVWWHCEKGHAFDATVNERTSNNTGCPICSNHRVLKGYNDLATTYPKLAKEWHPIKNGRITPNDVISGGNKKYWWLCNECGNECESTIHHRKNNRGCPNCAKRIRVQTRRTSFLANANNLKDTHHDLCKEWHPTKNDNLKPTDVTQSKGIKVWWLCPICDNEWEARIASRSREHGCPICGMKKAWKNRRKHK